MKILNKIVCVTVILGVLLLVNCKKDECEFTLITDVNNPSRCFICEDSSFNFVGDSSNCEKKSSQAATLNGSQFTLQAGDRSTAYGWGGAKVYSTIPSEYPYSTATSGNTMQDATATTKTPITSLSGIWTGTGSTTGRLNKVGVWSPSIGTNEWIGFSSCIDLTAKKKYYIGIAGDNETRIKINGILIANLNNTNTFNFTHWHIFEIELLAGTNIIEMEGLDHGITASFGAEIYDATLAQIQSWTTDAEIDSSIIFSTKDQLGQLTTIGDINGYSCPLGFAVDFCTGATVPVCTMIEKGIIIPCP